MKMISQEILNSVGELKDAQKWINEATFGLNHVEDFIAELSPGSNVLEVGSGSGILLSHLKNKFKNINFYLISTLIYIFLKDDLQWPGKFSWVV